MTTKIENRKELTHLLLTHYNLVQTKDSSAECLPPAYQLAHAGYITGEELPSNEFGIERGSLIVNHRVNDFGDESSVYCFVSGYYNHDDNRVFIMELGELGKPYNAPKKNFVTIDKLLKAHEKGFVQRVSVEQLKVELYKISAKPLLKLARTA